MPPLLITTRPTPPPILYQPTPLSGLSELVDCGRSDTDEACLGNGWVRLVGYLHRPNPNSVDFILVRGSMRATVELVPSEGHNPQNLFELERQHDLTTVEGWVSSLNPPSMLVTREARSARELNSGLPLNQTYSNPDWGITLQIPAGWMVEAGSDADTGSLYIQNFHSTDQFLTEAGGPYVPGDSSLYRMRLYPLPAKYVTTFAEARAGWSTVQAEKRITINGLEAIRFDSGALHELEVQLPGRVLNLATMQDPALFEQIIQTLRPLPTPPSTPAPRSHQAGRLLPSRKATSCCSAAMLPRMSFGRSNRMAASCYVLLSHLLNCLRM